MATVQALEALPGVGVLTVVRGGDRDGDLLVLVPRDYGRSLRTVEEVVDGCDIAPSLVERVREIRGVLARRAEVEPRRVVEVIANPSTRTASPPPPSPAQVVARSASSRAAARRLLESLLDPRQLASWRRSGRFVVDVPSGSVELGNLYNLRYRRPATPDAIICVVPEDHTTLPVEDIWTNLLVMLRTAPAEFFRVARYRTAH